MTVTFWLKKVFMLQVLGLLLIKHSVSGTVILSSVGAFRKVVVTAHRDADLVSEACVFESWN